MSADDREFHEPPWQAPLDAEAVIASIPADATMKGMFLEATVARARQAGVEVPQARPFGEVLALALGR